MKFKNSFHVFVDNFSVVYKHLLYKLIILAVSIGLYAAALYPFLKELTDSVAYKNVFDGLKQFIENFLNGRTEALSESAEKIKNGIKGVADLISQNTADLALSAIAIIVVHFIEKFLTGLGNYAMAAVINDRMALRAKSSYTLTLVRNLKEAALYNIMYVPISMVYDLGVSCVMFFVLFKALFFLPVLLQIFLFVTCMVLAISLKMTLTADWLPALISGKMKHGEAFLYTFSRKGKGTASVFSNFLVLVLLIFGLNVAAFICTLGVGLFLTIPGSYILLVAFEFVNYYDRNELKYFTDKNTIIKPANEKIVSREDFFKGE